ncbi:MAG TPA: cation transporting ATPase C-terminal domain-containing protein, partial [Gaiellaceae bacterium]|nr:cation transporting ATPase C-terminal domain-containing protein [Gaiellaceae bacterium]
EHSRAFRRHGGPSGPAKRPDRVERLRRTGKPTVGLDRAAAARKPLAQPGRRLGDRLLVLVLHVPLLQEAFGTQSLSPVTWLLVLGTALTIVPVLEIAKRVARRDALEGA